MGPVSRTPFALSHHQLLSLTSRGPTFPSGVQSPMAPLSLEEPSYPCSQPLRYLGQPWLSSLVFHFMSPPPGILPAPFLLRKLYPLLNAHCFLLCGIVIKTFHDHAHQISGECLTVTLAISNLCDPTTWPDAS